MRQAELASTTRRSLVAHSVAATAALAATASLALAVPSNILAHPDAGLMGLGADLDVAWAREAALRTAMTGLWTRENEHLFGEVTDASRVIIGEILTLPARTLDGIRVKAKAVSWCYDGEPIPVVGDGTATSENLMASIVNDLLAMAGGAA